MAAPGFSLFRRASQDGNVIPVIRELPADTLTPVLAYLSTASRARRSFLLESVEGGERLARYSFLGRDPYRTLSAHGLDLVEHAGRRVEARQGGFLDRLRELFDGLTPVSVPGLPPFTGGAVGYISYEAARLFEPAVGPGNGHRRPKGALPDAWFGFYDTVMAFDHLRQSIMLITSAMTQRDGRPLRRQYEAAVERLDRLASDLSRGMRVRRRFRGVNVAMDMDAPRSRLPKASVTRRGYDAMVAAAKRHIREGEVYQAVLSQRFETRLRTTPFSVYRALRRINPSPYMYFLADAETALAGASPEMLVRVEGTRVEVHPIAGTRPRGETPQEDAALEAELLADAKERAEHVMLVDLGRNDLGRVCDGGSVRVDELMKVERYSHVMHLVSRVTGTLARGRDAFDALKATFPAGTVSGAPKVRAMQIIQELEGAERGPYAGAVCYVDHSGNLDSCIVIRTMVSRGSRAFVQAGGGIVADSIPGREYQESVNKARAVLTAIERAGLWAP